MAIDLEHLRERIATEHQAGGYGMGWRLLYSPTHVLGGSPVAFLGINPGGSGVDPRHTDLASERGSAYVMESWVGYPPGESPLQRQVRALFAALDVDPDEVLAGNLIPFRSPSLDALPNRERALAFGLSLWKELLEAAQPSLVITMGAQTTHPVATMLGAERLVRVSLGWGSVAGTRASFTGGTHVGLPHLSRFRVFGRQESEAGLRKLLGL